MSDEMPEFKELGNLIGAYLGQDMEDLIADTVPEAIVDYVKTTLPAHREAVLREMEDFIHRYHNNAEAEFERRWGYEYTPDCFKKQTTVEFFDMIRAIFADPECYKRYLSN